MLHSINTLLDVECSHLIHSSNASVHISIAMQVTSSKKRKIFEILFFKAVPKPIAFKMGKSKLKNFPNVECLRYTKIKILKSIMANLREKKKRR